MAKAPPNPPEEDPIKYPYKPHEFLVSQRLLDHLSSTAQEELKALADAGTIKFVE